MAEGEPTRFDSYADDIGKSFRVSAFRAGEGRLALVLRDTTAERHAEAERLRFLRQTTDTDSLAEGESKTAEFEGLFRNTVENIPINFISVRPRLPHPLRQSVAGGDVRVVRD